MEIPDPLTLYILTAFISLSGVMMPGPVTAATVAKGYKNKNAGVLIALGHGVVEFPLIAIIALGFGPFFQNQGVKIAIGIIGGSMLIYLGYNMVKMRKEIDESEKYLPYHPITVGVITTMTNPYFFIWWATIGLLLIGPALGFGIEVLIIFAVLHWSFDFAWDSFLSFVVFKSKKLWFEKLPNIIFGLIGILMIFLGAYFIISPGFSG